MIDRTHRSGAIGALGLAFLIGACSSAPAGPASASAAPATASAAPATAPETPSASGAPASDPIAGGGGGAMAWCLNTPEEVSKAFGVGATTATGTDAPGVGGGCAYTETGGGQPVYGISVVTGSVAVTTWDNIVSAPGVESFSGIGDGAILVGPDGPFVILKGSTLASIGAMSVQSDKATYRTALEELARSAAPRMP